LLIFAGKNIKTLIINFYPCEKEAKIIFYVELIRNFSNYQVVQENEFTPHLIKNSNALVLSGSPKMLSQGEYKEEFLEILKNISLPVLGICYGHQLLAKTFGAQIGRYSKFIEKEEEIYILDKKDIFCNLPDKIVAKESHQEYVIKNSLENTNLEVIAFSQTCEVEAIRHKERKVFGVQFHLERSGDIGYKIMKNFYEKVVFY